MLNFHHADESCLFHCRPMIVINTSISRKCHILLNIVQTNEKSLWKLMIVTRVVPPCLTSRQPCIWRHIRQPEPKAHSWISSSVRVVKAVKAVTLYQENYRYHMRNSPKIYKGCRSWKLVKTVYFSSVGINYNHIYIVEYRIDECRKQVRVAVPKFQIHSDYTYGDYSYGI